MCSTSYDSMRDQKVARFIGITSHTDPAVLKTALERHDFDCTQMALNARESRNGEGCQRIRRAARAQLRIARAARSGAEEDGHHRDEGVRAGADLKAPAKDLIRYSLSLPVTACVVGMPKLEFIEENIALAKAFKPLGREEMQRISGELVPTHKAKIDAFFADHIDA